MFILKIILPIKNIKNLIYYSKHNKYLNIGSRVIVPLKNYKFTGIIKKIYIEKKNKKKFKIKKIIKILDKKIIINKKFLILIKIITKYYQIPFNIFLFNLIPKYTKKIYTLKTKYKNKHKIFKKINKKNIKIINKINLITKNNIWLLIANFKNRINLYIDLIKKNILNKKQILFLVPQKYLIKKIKKYIYKHICLSIGIINSKIPNTQKNLIWKKTLENKINLIIGTRSAIFTPFSKLNLIIIEEENSKYYKENNKFSYHSKNVGLIRSKIENIPIILGSLTPCIKSYYKTKINKYKIIKINNHKYISKKKIINIKNYNKKKEIHIVLKKILYKYIIKKKNIYIFINIKGYSWIICKYCKSIQKCSFCKKKYILYKKKNKIIYCKCTKKLILIKCSKCKKKKFLSLGWGTKKIREILIKIFPLIKIKIINLKNKNKYTQQILISNKLHWNKNIPKPILTLIFNIDYLLYSNNYQSIENFINIYTSYINKININKNQKIFFLTSFPKHNIFKHLIKENNYENIIKKILKERKLINYPPYVHESLIKINYINNNIYKLYRNIKLISKKKNIRISKPFLNKKKNIYTWEIIIQSKIYKNLFSFIKEIKKKWKNKIKFKIDIDYNE